MLGTVGEIVIPISGGHWDFWQNQGIKGHIIMYSALALLYFCEILHIKRILVEPIWSFVPFSGLMMISLMFQFHDQPALYLKYLHLTTSYLLAPIILFGTAMVVCQMYYRTSKVSKNVDNLTPHYTNPAIFDTPLIGLVAFTSFMQAMAWGELWWIMGWLDADLEIPPQMDHHLIAHPEHSLLDTLMKHLFIVLVLMAVISRIGRSSKTEDKEHALETHNLSNAL